MKAPLPFRPELWEQTPPAVRDSICTLEASMAALEAAVQRLETMVQQLMEPLQHTSRTSSRLPSSDPLQALGPRPYRKPSSQRPSGQPGHGGHVRALVPVEEVDLVMPVKPMRCRRCHAPLQGDEA